MRVRHALRGRPIRTLVVAGAVASSVLAVAPPATAATVQGALEVKSIGFLYAGAHAKQDNANAIVTRTVSVGQTAAFSLKVVNTGSVTASYNVNISYADSRIAYHLLAGFTDVTAAANSPAGYVTPSLAPGKSKQLTLKIITPADATPFDEYAVATTLGNAGSNFGTTEELVNIATSKGTTDDDVFVSTSGQKTTCACGGAFVIVSSATVAAQKQATFKLKLANDSASAVTYVVGLTDNRPSECGNFDAALMLGTANITAAAEGFGGYTTSVVPAHGSVTLTLTLTNAGTWPPSCLQGNFGSAIVEVSDGHGLTSGAYLVTNAV